MNTTIQIAQQIKAIILEYIGKEIGVYKFSNGVTTPAICIESFQKYPPNGTEIAGLEVSILPAVLTELNPYLSRSNEWIYQSDILLKQWDSNSDTSVALEEIIPGLQELGIVQVFPRSPSNEVLQIIESVRVRVTQSFYRYNLPRSS